MFASILSFFTGDYNERHVRLCQKRLPSINEACDSYASLADDEFAAQTQILRDRVASLMAGGKAVNEALDEILPEAFGLVKQACIRLNGQEFSVKGQKKIWNMIPYDVQLVGGMILNQGYIAEMKTGEGKTLVAALPAYLNALAHSRVFVITVNDYLASRDAEWMANLYTFLGLTVGCVVKSVPLGTRRDQYSSDVVYVENAELGFDYLRDNLVTSMAERNLLRKSLDYAIVDEADSILIDEARTPLIISEPDKEPTEKYAYYAKIIQTLTPARGKKKVSKGFLHDMMEKSKDLGSDETAELPDDGGDYHIDEKSKTALLTGEGITKLEKMLNVENLYVDFGFEEIHHIENALKARACYSRDKEYLIHNNEVLIVDEHTGRSMPGRRFSDGLHQAIEAKEGVRIQNESKTLATITYQNFFKLFTKLSGMTGTALTEAEEFDTIYKIQTFAVPTNKPIIRVDLGDKVYFNQDAKWKKILNDIQFAHTHGQPLLIGTATIDTSEYVSSLLTKNTINHSVLNAKYHEQEAHIVQNAGKYKSVMVATNMAGRGTDIQLDPDLNITIAKSYATRIMKTASSFAAYRDTQSKKDAIDYAKDSGYQKAGLMCQLYSAYEYDCVIDAWKASGTLSDQDFSLMESAGGRVTDTTTFFVKNHKQKENTQPYATIYCVDHGAAETFSKKPQSLVGQDLRFFSQSLHFGLFVLGTEKHESRRIDNQLRGRAGRQGDPGVTVFYVSLDDTIMRKMGGDKIQSIAQLLLPAKELGIFELTQTQFSDAIARAQRQMEARHFSGRKHLFEYDSVVDIQRRAMYKKRDALIATLETIEPDAVESFFLEQIDGYVEPLVDHLFALSYAQNENTDDLPSIVLQQLAVVLPHDTEWTRESLLERLTQHIHAIGHQLDTAQKMMFLRHVVIRSIDRLWIDHIDQMQELREKVGLMGYAQQDPLVAYKKESFDRYRALLHAIETTVIRELCLANITMDKQLDSEQQADNAMVDQLRSLASGLTIPKNQQKNTGSPQTRQSSGILEQSDEFEVFEEGVVPQKNQYSDLSPKKLRPNDKVTVRYTNGTYGYDVKYKKVIDEIERGECEIVG